MVCPYRLLADFSLEFSVGQSLSSAPLVGRNRAGLVLRRAATPLETPVDCRKLGIRGIVKHV